MPAVRDQARSDSGVSSYSAQIWRTVDEVDAQAWERLCGPGELLMDLKLLRVMENSLAKAVSFRYVMLCDATGNPAAATCLFTHTLDGTYMAGQGLLGRLARWVGKVLPALVYYKLLFCGTPLSAGQSYIRFAPDVDRRAVFAALDDLFQRVAREEKARCIVLMEFSDDELAGLEAARELGYHRADTLPMNEVHVAEETWDEYLAALDKRRRRKIVASRKKLAAGGLQVVTTSDPSEVERRFTGDVYRLYEAVAVKADLDFIRLPAEFFCELARQVPDHCEYIFFMEGDVVRAFVACLFSTTSYDPLFVGLDYEKNHDFDLYFNMLYEIVFAALRHKVHDIRFGQDADHVKHQRLGCTRSPRYFFVKGVIWPLKVVLRLLARHLFPPRPVSAITGDEE